VYGRDLCVFHGTCTFWNHVLPVGHLGAPFGAKWSTRRCRYFHDGTDLPQHHNDPNRQFDIINDKAHASLEVL